MKQAERTARTKAGLINAFWKLYKTKPLDQISVREITDAAGVYRSTFYLYFKDAAMVLAHLEEELLARLETKLEWIGHPLELKDIPSIVAEFYNKDGSYLYPLLKEGGDHAFADRVLALLQPRVAADAALDEQQTAQAVRFCFYASVALMSDAYPHRRKKPLEDVAAFAATLIADTSNADKGADNDGTSSSTTASACDTREDAAASDAIDTNEAASVAADTVAVNDKPHDADIDAPEAAAVSKPAAKSTKPKKANTKKKRSTPKPKQDKPIPATAPEDEDIQMALF